MHNLSFQPFLLLHHPYLTPYLIAAYSVDELCTHHSAPPPAYLVPNRPPYLRPSLAPYLIHPRAAGAAQHLYEVRHRVVTSTQACTIIVLSAHDHHQVRGRLHAPAGGGRGHNHLWWVVGMVEGGWGGGGGCGKEK